MDLTRKTGKDRFTLEEAVKKIPALKKHIKPIKSSLAIRRIGQNAVKSSGYSAKGREVTDDAFKDIWPVF